MAMGICSSLLSCSQPSGYVDNVDDCNDSEALAWSGADEVCDGIDNDCDGDVDGTAIDKTVWYMDSDLDSYGDPNNSTEDCSQPSGYVANMDDCNDSEPTAWSGALEYCDGIDNNCSGNEYDALDAIFYHPDSDGDGYGDENEAYPLCEPPGGLLVGCYDVSMFDTGSDGWNGGSDHLCEWH